MQHSQVEEYETLKKTVFVGKKREEMDGPKSLEAKIFFFCNHSMSAHYSRIYMYLCMYVYETNRKVHSMWQCREVNDDRNDVIRSIFEKQCSNNTRIVLITAFYRVHVFL